MVAAGIPWLCRCSAVQCSAVQCLRAASPKHTRLKQLPLTWATHCASLGACAGCLVRRCSGRSRRTMRRSRRSRSLRRPCGAPRTASVGCAKSAAHTHTHTHTHTHGRNAVAAGLARLIDRSIGRLWCLERVRVTAEGGLGKARQACPSAHRQVTTSDIRINEPIAEGGFKTVTHRLAPPLRTRRTY